MINYFLPSDGKLEGLIPYLLTVDTEVSLPNAEWPYTR